MLAQLVRQRATPHGRLVSSADRLAVQELPTIIGRSPVADISVPDPWVSRLHCQIDERRGVLFVRDLDSRHGTFVNRARVTESLLLPGDELEIGLTTFRIEYEACSCSPR